jgi:hypothetical protein
MSVKGVMSALLAALFITVVASPALACKGTQSLLRDDFTEQDLAWSPLWEETSTFEIGDGKLVAGAEPGYWGLMMYEGAFFPAADACVDITMPTVTDPALVWGGLAFYSEDATFVVYLTPDGKAGVWRVNADGWLGPVKAKAFDAIKVGETNSLRVVWSGPPASGSSDAANPIVEVSVNDQPLFKFKVKPNTNRKIGIGVQTEGESVEFSNLAVTQ